MNDIVLSICVASYNKEKTTYNLVKSLLTNKSCEFEVVVVDNASTDNTVQILKDLKDKRFRIIENEKNIGGAANMVKAVYAGRGRFSLYTNDRDYVLPDKIDDFISFLKAHPYITGGFCVRDDNGINDDYTEYSPAQALIEVCYRNEHPTGFFYNRKMLDLVPEERLREYINSEKYVPFPWENLQAELACIGNTVSYNRVIWKSTGDVSHKSYISSYVELHDESDRWFSPKNCMERAIANVNNLLHLCHINNIELSEKEKYKAFALIIVSQQKIGLWRYKRILESESLAYHYAVRQRKVPYKEMILINRKFVYDFIKHIQETIGKRSSYERKILSNIRYTNLRMLRGLFINKIASYKIIRVIRGKNIY